MTELSLNAFANDVHENAVAHGWWETERHPMETIALIHSEWSEALEEYRSKRPMIWFHCDEYAPHETGPMCSPLHHPSCLRTETHECRHRGKKPEGIAVELIDGCIRILDLFGHNGYSFKYEDPDMLMSYIGELYKVGKEIPLPRFVANLHFLTAKAGEDILMNRLEKYNPTMLEVVVGQVFCWLKNQGVNPVQVMLMKHEYNKTRPYRHGNKQC